MNRSAFLVTKNASECRRDARDSTPDRLCVLAASLGLETNPRGLKAFLDNRCRTAHTGGSSLTCVVALGQVLRVPLDDECVGCAKRRSALRGCVSVKSSA
eukprot:Gregarina_sp_Poly_1__6112@NODE_322_length_9532_cov_315_419546_g274_i0_p12_GENE_NODE_322_length_9532_cov_315_419546_g274_i0NODE_322_length_9532_cov_315_419546_g274_i0_p12_ORF_typecomplete_len100_score9_22DUF3716/PF12511_8/65DUF3716/PF12511_8/0_096_NODE_322_length_9532_cov_315_419546_g274_i069057204